jgi:hypothetical protein
MPEFRHHKTGTFLEAGATSTLSATFSDAGISDTHAAAIDWGDGVIEQVTLITGSHQYPLAGRYTVTVSVTDDDGGVGVDTLAVSIPGITGWGLVALAAGLGLLTVVYASRAAGYWPASETASIRCALRQAQGERLKGASRPR